MKLRILLIHLFLLYSYSYSQNSNQKIELRIQTKNKEDTAIINKKRSQHYFSSTSEITTNLLNLENQLKEEGYIDTTHKLEKKNDSLHIANFHLGNLYTKINLLISKNTDLLYYIDQTGVLINENSIEIDYAFAKAYLEQLSTIAANSGKPFSEFQIINLEKETSNKLKGQLTFTTHNTRTIDDIIIKDYKDLPQSFIKYQAKIKKGTIFNKDQINNQSETLASLPFVTENKKPEVLFTKDSTKIFLNLSKRNANLFDGFLGFTSNDDGSLQLNGNLNISLINNLNYGESLRVNYRADGNDQTQLSIKTELPYIFKSPVGIEASLELFRRDSTFSTSTFTINTTYQLKPNSNLKLGITSLNSTNLLETTTTTDDISSFSKNAATVTYSYIKQQKSKLFPIRTHFILNSSYGQRESSDQTTNQLSISLEASHIFSLTDSHKLFLQNKTSHLTSDNFIVNELYRLGGTNTIRGFNENSIFANWFTSFNTEYRFVLNNNFYLNSIIDAAYFVNELQDQENGLISYGIGSGIFTKAGLLKFNLANGSFNGESIQFSNTRLQLSLIVSF